MTPTIRHGAVYGNLMPRYFRGAYDDVQTLPRTGAARDSAPAPSPASAG